MINDSKILMIGKTAISWMYNHRFFGGDKIECISQEFLMIVSDAGDDTNLVR
jgi:hypothetical protein